LLKFNDERLFRLEKPLGYVEIKIAMEQIFSRKVGKLLFLRLSLFGVMGQDNNDLVKNWFLSV